LKDSELAPEGEDLRLELKTRPVAGPEGGEEGDQQRGHAGLERDQPPVRIRNDDKRFGVSARDKVLKQAAHQFYSVSGSPE
jgi:hypothetical protein